MVQHKIGGWSGSKGIFVSDEDRCRAPASRSGRVFPSVDVPDEVFMLLESEGVEGAQAFADELERGEAVKGVTSEGWSAGPPESVASASGAHRPARYSVGDRANGAAVRASCALVKHAPIAL